MDNNSKSIAISCRLLELYGIAAKVNNDEIKNLKISKSKLYGMQHIYSFDYKNKHYYVSDDYSLMDNPNYIENIFKEVNPNLKGHLITNPAPQSDGANYASGLDGMEYYLWEAPLD